MYISVLTNNVSSLTLLCSRHLFLRLCHPILRCNQNSFLKAFQSGSVLFISFCSMHISSSILLTICGYFALPAGKQTHYFPPFSFTSHKLSPLIIHLDRARNLLELNLESKNCYFSALPLASTLLVLFNPALHLHP